MNRKYVVFAAALTAVSVAHADPLVVELNQKVQYLEDQNRELRGTVEELTHAYRSLNQKFETFSSDVEMRLSTQTQPKAPLAQGPQNLGATPHGAPSSILQEPVAAAQPKLDPKVAYENARSLLERGDYPQASTKFSEFISEYPQDAHIPSANYWLGVSHLVQGHYDQAASTFANVYKTYPTSEKAPESLLKMAKALSAMGRKSDACTTLNEFNSKFSGKLKAQHQQEWNTIGCQ